MSEGRKELESALSQAYARFKEEGSASGSSSSSVNQDPFAFLQRKAQDTRNRAQLVAEAAERSQKAPTTAEIQAASARVGMGKGTDADLKLLDQAERLEVLTEAAQIKIPPKVKKTKNPLPSPVPSEPPPLRRMDLRGVRAMQDVAELSESLLAKPSPVPPPDNPRLKDYNAHIFAPPADPPGLTKNKDLPRILAHGMHELFAEQLEGVSTKVPPRDPHRSPDEPGMMANAIDESGQRRVSDPVPPSTMPLVREPDDPWHPDLNKGMNRMFFTHNGLAMGGLSQPIDELLGPTDSYQQSWRRLKEEGSGPFGDISESLLQTESHES
jgi:hypothetical protein